MIYLFPRLWADDYNGQVIRPRLFIRQAWAKMRFGQKTTYYLWQPVRQWWGPVFVSVGTPFWDTDHLFKRTHWQGLRKEGQESGH
jgi:hypothetical protein